MSSESHLPVQVELYRPLDVGRVPPAGLDTVVEADERECRLLAERMGVPAVQSLRCAFHLTLEGESVVLTRGHLRATVVQTCVVSLEDFEVVVEERFAARFVPLGAESEDDNPESIDEIPYEGRIVDLGEAAVEQLGLALDPYPRMPGAKLAGEDAGEVGGPFAALAALRRNT